MKKEKTALRYSTNIAIVLPKRFVLCLWIDLWIVYFQNSNTIYSQTLLIFLLLCWCSLLWVVYNSTEAIKIQSHNCQIIHNPNYNSKNLKKRKIEFSPTSNILCNFIYLSIILSPRKNLRCNISRSSNCRFWSRMKHRRLRTNTVSKTLKFQ